MFKDCKSGGYNLEECKASQERLNRIVLLIAIAYTCAGLAGQKNHNKSLNVNVKIVADKLL